MLQECHSLQDMNESNVMFYDFIVGGKKTPEEVAAWQLATVDVRDVADGHIRALEVPEAGGERIILSGWMGVAQDFCRPSHISDVGRCLMLTSLNSRYHPRASNSWL